MIANRVVTMLAVAILAGGCGVRSSASLAERARDARTPEEHARVAQGYRERAERLRDEVRQHLSTAQWASNHGERPFGGAEGTRRYEDEAQHCRAVAPGLTQAADEMDALAKFHDRMTTSSGATTTKP